jgi:hypothetical protein
MEIHSGIMRTSINAINISGFINLRRLGVTRLDKVMLYIALISIYMISACSSNTKSIIEINKEPSISPDYSGVTIPPNIAPLNFIIHETAKRYIIKISGGNKASFTIHTSDSMIIISQSKWKKILEASRGEQLKIEVMGEKNAQWTKYRPIIITVAKDSIDSYLVYRLIPPGFEIWNKMGIYQRCVENYDQDPIMINDLSDGNCMNCHSFCKNNSETFMFHMRAKNAGTIIFRNGKLSKVDTKTTSTVSAGVYPAWHPGGRYIAFSVNKIVQRFHAVSNKKIEVQDTLSDIVLYDCETNTVTTDSSLASSKRLETFPSWSPDGKFLYFCSAKSMEAYRYKDIRYDLVRIAFNPETKSFGATDTVISSYKTGLSVSFPRVSPDGKFVLFCMSAYGNFSIWHRESDLYLLNLETNEISKPEINSPESESYHSWSSNGRWIVFSSRRMDGLYTRPYFSYFDASGKTHKPFLLPQKNPDFYEGFMNSFNIPELITSRLKLDPRILSRIAKSEAIKANFISSK